MDYEIQLKELLRRNAEFSALLKCEHANSKLIESGKAAWRFNAVASKLTIQLPYSHETGIIANALVGFQKFIELYTQFENTCESQDLLIRAKEYLGLGYQIAIPKNQKLAAAVKLVQAYESTRERVRLLEKLIDCRRQFESFTLE